MKRSHRTLLMQVLHNTRSKRLLMEQLDYNLPTRWFVGLNMDERMWDTTILSKNRQQVLAESLARAVFAWVSAQVHAYRMLSDDHSTVDPMLIDALTRTKGFRHMVAATRSQTDDPGIPTAKFHAKEDACFTLYTRSVHENPSLLFSIGGIKHI